MDNHTNENCLSRNIFLIGFMGAGKSTVARMLRELTGARVIEMDQDIQERNGMTIPEIFRTKGEPYFREEETQLLVRLQSTEPCIVSCGGGVAMREQNVQEMRKSGKIVLLTAEPETILERVRDDDTRPLLQGRKNVRDIGELMEQRRPKYEAAADVTVRTDGKSPARIAREILDHIDGV